MSVRAEDPSFWRKEAGLCARDEMYGCAAFALSEYLRLDPEADNQNSREQIATWKKLGDVAAHFTHEERAQRAMQEGTARRSRRFNALTRRASTKGLSPDEEREMTALASELDRA